MDATNRKTKTVEESRVEQVHIIRQSHLNGAGRLFGGTLLQWIDEVAGVCAKRHSETNVTTAAIDNLQFLRGAFLSDLIVLIATISYVGRTSMEVRVEAFAEKLDGTRVAINRAYLVMVALNVHGDPLVVPRLKLVTEEEKEEWLGGEKRKAIRTTRRAEGF